MIPKTEQDVVKQVNELGEKVAQLFEGVSSVVVLNLTLLLFVGANKSVGYHKEDAHEAIDSAWDKNAGLTAETIRPS